MLSVLISVLCFANQTNMENMGDMTEYNNYLKTFNKNYDTSNYWQHFFLFNDNMRKIRYHNNENHTWKMGSNNFTDISRYEYKNIYLRTNINSQNNSIFKKVQMKIPEAIDWRAENLVTNIKDQGQCGSCWAFSAVGSIEGANARKTGNLTSLSEQNLVDCAENFGCEGCNGGWMNAAMEYVHYNHGIDSESEYPYTAVDGVCDYKKNESAAKVRSVFNISKGDDEALLHAVATIGPISVAIDAEYDFQLYQSGIYSSTECSKESLDHGVLIVGYGVTSSGRKYYIIKNSWGTSWGMNGYVYWDRDIPNMCGIAQAASFPTM